MHVGSEAFLAFPVAEKAPQFHKTFSAHKPEILMTDDSVNRMKILLCHVFAPSSFSSSLRFESGISLLH